MPVPVQLAPMGFADALCGARGERMKCFLIVVVGAPAGGRFAVPPGRKPVLSQPCWRPAVVVAPPG